jgi:vancomycin permeability regulator SanA
MRGLKFLSLLTFIVTGAAIIYALTGKDDYHSIFEDIERGSATTLTFTEKVKSYFVYADSWNYLTLAVFISLLIFLFVFNDYLIGKIFEHYNKDHKGDNSFLSGGIVWLFRMITSAAFVFIEFVLISNLIIFYYSSDKIIDNPREITAKKAVLLLGTNKLTQSGKDNLYYYARIEAVVDLYKSGKVRKIVISGDRSGREYNEPKDMMRDLVKRGVPRRIIVLDPAGFRTLDSIVRLKLENKITDAIIVSQKFHVERALFLSWFYNIEAKAYVAKGNMTSQMVKRELFAKPKVLMDLFLFNMQPKVGRTQARAAVDLKKDKDLVILVTVSTLLLASGFLLKSTFVY